MLTTGIQAVTLQNGLDQSGPVLRAQCKRGAEPFWIDPEPFVPEPFCSVNALLVRKYVSVFKRCQLYGVW